MDDEEPCYALKCIDINEQPNLSPDGKLAVIRANVDGRAPLSALESSGSGVRLQGLQRAGDLLQGGSAAQGSRPNVRGAVSPFDGFPPQDPDQQ